MTQYLILYQVIQELTISVNDIITANVDERAQYPVEFLNSLTPCEMPPHRLRLKVGAIVMILRNLNLHEGLCNGTRLLIYSLHDNCIDAEVLTGKAKHTRVLIPRLQLAPSDTDMPFVLSRCQYPLRLSYSMTINKAQGQTFNKVGICIQRPCFSHGQLYIAFSRARRFADVNVQIMKSSSHGKHRGATYTNNVVYSQVLT